MKKKVLILGSLGMLGQELARVFGEDDAYEVTALDKESIDVTNAHALRVLLETNMFDVVCNAVAYNAVDLCEADDAAYTMAMALNKDVPARLAEESARLGFTLVHYSTDYVFDGEAGEGYAEDAVPHPLSRYGYSKRAGEEAVLAQAKKYYVIRLSKLFGKPASSAQGKRSFFDVMLEAGKQKPEVKVVDSEKSCFTYAPDLALETKTMYEAQVPYGIYHMTNSHAVTWYEAVQTLYSMAQMTTLVTPVSPDAFPRPAKRPVFSALLSTKRPPLRPYEEALQEYLEQSPSS